MPKSRIKLNRNNVLPRFPEKKRESELFVIAVEGEKTEKQYFEKFGDTRIRIEILPTRDGFSKPADILNRLMTPEIRAKYDVGEGDQFWMVFDVDHWDRDEIHNITLEATSKSIQLAISNPCFEFWLFLHKFDRTEIDNKLQQCPVEKRAGVMKEILNGTNQNYNQFNKHEFREDVKNAIQRARKQENGRQSRFPEFPSTDVYLLVERLPFKE